MYDQTAERVAYLRHAERLAHLSENVRLAEIAAERRQGRRLVWDAYREMAAKALIALAARLAPRMALSASSTQTTTR